MADEKSLKLFGFEIKKAEEDPKKKAFDRTTLWNSSISIWT